MAKDMDALTKMIASVGLEDKITKEEIEELEGKKLLKLFSRSW